jgi:hypothetical protein
MCLNAFETYLKSNTILKVFDLTNQGRKLYNIIYTHIHQNTAIASYNLLALYVLLILRSPG